MHFHSNRPTTAKRNPLLAPGWLPLVLRRIDDSTVLPGRTIQDCQEELTIEVGFAARRFFELYGDLLLGEPYLYATPYGDLAAEFSIGGTRLTAIVSERRLILFSVGSGEPSYRYVDDWLERPEVVAAAMRQIASPTSSVIV